MRSEKEDTTVTEEHAIIWVQDSRYISVTLKIFNTFLKQSFCCVIWTLNIGHFGLIGSYTAMALAP